LHDAMKRSGAKINYKPLAIGSVFEASDTPLLGKRHKTRQAYRTLELQRWAVKRGLEFNFWPAHWPFAAATGDKMIIAAVESGDDPSEFMRQVFTGIWNVRPTLPKKQPWSALPMREAWTVPPFLPNPQAMRSLRFATRTLLPQLKLEFSVSRPTSTRVNISGVRTG
jgi:hypothetical protein